MDAGKKIKKGCTPLEILLLKWKQEERIVGDGGTIIYTEKSEGESECEEEESEVEPQPVPTKKKVDKSKLKLKKGSTVKKVFIKREDKAPKIKPAKKSCKIQRNRPVVVEAESEEDEVTIEFSTPMVDLTQTSIDSPHDLPDLNVRRSPRTKPSTSSPIEINSAKKKLAFDVKGEASSSKPTEQIKPSQEDSSLMLGTIMSLLSTVELQRREDTEVMKSVTSDIAEVLTQLKQSNDNVRQESVRSRKVATKLAQNQSDIACALTKLADLSKVSKDNAVVMSKAVKDLSRCSLLVSKNQNSLVNKTGILNATVSDMLNGTSDIAI